MTGWYLANVTAIQSALIGVLLALSMQVTIRVGILSVSGIAFYGISEYSTAIIVIHGYLSWVLAVAVSAVACVILSYLLAVLLRRVRGLYLTMVTIALMLILNVVASNGGSLTGGANGLYGVPPSGGTSTLLVLCLVAIGVSVLTERRGAGRAAEALRADELLATSVGIDPRRIRLINFLWSGVLGSLAGSLNVLTFGSVGPFDASFPLAVTTLTAVVVGGRRSWFGAVIGAVLVTALPTLMSSFNGTWQDLVFGVLVVLVATFAPDGLGGLVSRSGRAAWGHWRSLPQRQAVEARRPVDV